MKKFAIIIALVFGCFVSPAQTLLPEGVDHLASDPTILVSASSAQPEIWLALAVTRDPGTGREEKSLIASISTYPHYDIQNDGLLLIRTVDGTVLEFVNEMGTSDNGRLKSIHKAAQNIPLYPHIGCYPVTDLQLSLMSKGLQKVRLQYMGGVVELDYTNDSMFHSLSAVAVQMMQESLQSASDKMYEKCKAARLNSLQDIREGF